MKGTLNRRDFTKAAALGLGAMAVPALQGAEKKIKIGHTCITWGTFPRGEAAFATLEPAVKDIAETGFWGFETFPEVLEAWDAKGTLQGLMDRYKLPLTSAYFRINVTDPALQKDNVAQTIRLGKIVKKYGGHFGAIQVNSVKRQGYDYKAHRANIIAGLNDCSKALNDLGLGAGLHQHTGTAIETRDEVYDVMGAVDTRYVKFAPDVGQLQKGGVDALKVVKDFLPLVLHMHLKDFSGGRFFAGYCPLGLGQVDIKGIMEVLEQSNPQAYVMVELDGSPDAPMTALQTVQVTKTYLKQLGYGFRS
jgi:inosose dehydratase